MKANEAPEKLYFGNGDKGLLDIYSDKEFESFLDNIEGVPRMWHSDEQIEWGKDIARHFFELGIRFNNPITATDRCTAEEIIINLKRIESDYRIDLTKEIEWLRNQVKK